MTDVPAHGGNLRLASGRYGRPEGGWLDFSANINPLGLPHELREALMQAIAGGALERYPDPDAVALRSVLARRHGLPPEMVLPGNGASEALHLALAALPRGPVALPAPCFGEYGPTAELYGHEVLPVPLDPDSFGLPLPRRRYAGVILGHPNNPTSRLVDRDCLRAWLDACGWAVVDEAFVELTAGGEGNSAIPLLAEYPNLIVLRALTKLLAIPGLRLGYAAAGTEWIGAMARRQPAWSVNALAQAVGDQLDGLGDYLERTRRWIAEEPRWLFDRLSAMAGLAAWPPDTNFILCRGDMPAARLSERLAERGILIRVASNFLGLDDRHFRVAVRARQQNERLLAALREALYGA